MQVNKVIGHVIGMALLLLATTVHGQTCIDAITPTAPDSRYQDNGDGTVTDLPTGLMWQRCRVGRSGRDCTSAGSLRLHNWSMALQYPQTLNSSGGFAGFSDWRLPNSKELESLVEEACYLPAINLTHFPNTNNYAFWSSSPDASDSNGTGSGAWALDFYRGDTSGSRISSGYYVRLVRSIP